LTVKAIHPPWLAAKLAWYVTGLSLA